MKLSTYLNRRVFVLDLAHEYSACNRSNSDYLQLFVNMSLHSLCIEVSSMLRWRFAEELRNLREERAYRHLKRSWQIQQTTN